jgi:hypothetical protein
MQQKSFQRQKKDREEKRGRGREGQSNQNNQESGRMTLIGRLIHRDTHTMAT